MALTFTISLTRPFGYKTAHKGGLIAGPLLYLVDKALILDVAVGWQCFWRLVLALVGGFIKWPMVYRRLPTHQRLSLVWRGWLAALCRRIHLSSTGFMVEWVVDIWIIYLFIDWFSGKEHLSRVVVPLSTFSDQLVVVSRQCNDRHRHTSTSRSLLLLFDDYFIVAAIKCRQLYNVNSKYMNLYC